VEDRHDPQTWQELLRQLIENPKEKKHIASLANIQPITLSRWSQGTSMPRTEKMRSLLEAIPEPSFRTFVQLISVGFPTLVPGYIASQSMSSVPSLELSAEFYVHVLKTYATTLPHLCPQVLQDQILQHMINQFGSSCPDLTIRIARCFWHRTENKVRSLQVVRGIGHSPWSSDLGQQTVLLGAESLAGMTVMRYRLTVASKQTQDSLLNPLSWEEHEQSALACPLMCQARIAGCLLMASTQPDAFREAHYKLVESYAHLMALAFEPDAFFDLQDIVLCMMPPSSRQEPLFRQFRQRALQKVQHQSLTMHEAQECVWQEIEEELIQMAVTGV
jgi:hypothetical protein